MRHEIRCINQFCFFFLLLTIGNFIAGNLWVMKHGQHARGIPAYAAFAAFSSCHTPVVRCCCFIDVGARTNASLRSSFSPIDRDRRVFFPTRATPTIDIVTVATLNKDRSFPQVFVNDQKRCLSRLQKTSSNRTEFFSS